MRTSFEVLSILFYLNSQLTLKLVHTFFSKWVKPLFFALCWQITEKTCQIKFQPQWFYGPRSRFIRERIILWWNSVGLYVANPMWLVGWVLTYFLTFVLKIKNDKIPRYHMSGGNMGSERIANVSGPSWAPVSFHEVESRHSKKSDKNSSFVNNKSKIQYYLPLPCVKLRHLTHWMTVLMCNIITNVVMLYISNLNFRLIIGIIFILFHFQLSESRWQFCDLFLLFCKFKQMCTLLPIQ